MKIGFMGLGKLGLPCALAIESRNHEVVGYDYDPHINDYLEERKIPYKEEGVQPLLDKTKIKIRLPEDMVGDCDIIFIAVQTPHKEKFEGITRLPEEREDFNYMYLKDAMITLSKAADRKRVDQIVAVISTVLPGTMDSEILPYCSDRLKIAYNPFFIAMGTTVKDFLDPEFILLGMDDPEAINVVEQFYKLTIPWSGKDVPIFKCSIKTAEAIKVLYNTYITQKIVFANAAMELCHKTGADVDDLIDCLSLGHRRIISPMYMRGGMGDGGGCHPRDNIALSAVARKYDMSCDWWEAMMVAREKQTNFLIDLIISTHRLTAFPIIILGKAFKPETNLTVGSPSILLYNMLKEDLGLHEDCVEIFDPHVDNKVKPWRKDPCIFFIGTKHEIFKKYAEEEFPEGSIVIDPWRYIPHYDELKVIRIGDPKRYG